MSERVVVIGGDAAGMSAAHQALRTARERERALEVVVLERSEWTLYSACGIPYWIAGQVPSAADLVARSPEEHRAAGIDLRTGATATALDTHARRVEYVDSGGTHRLDYDQLVVATGAVPQVPDWAEDGTGTGVVHTLDDGAAWLARLGGGPHRVVVAGGGFVGLEMAEALLDRGHRVSLVTRSRVMSSLEPAMSDRLHDGLREAGVDLHLGAEVAGIDRHPDGRLRSVRTATGPIEADLLLVALGVRPATGFLTGSGVPLDERGALAPDPSGRVADGVWAAGDCCLVRHRITGQTTYLPLGTHANKMGRALGESLAGGHLEFPGALGTVITRFAAGGVHVEIARTGLSVADARTAGWNPVEVTTEGTTASGYMPEAEPLAISLLGDPATGRLLGGQVVGGHGAAKRIDVVAAVLWGEMTVDQLAWMDLSYAPPFATAWEIVSLAARRLADRM